MKTSRKYERLRFRGTEYILVGDRSCGAIATVDEFESFRLNQFHLKDGKVWSFGSVVGTEEEIEWLPDPYVRPTTDEAP